MVIKGQTAVRLSLNLLPPEILLERKQGEKLKVINNISLALLLSLVLMSSTVLFLKVNQKNTLEQTKDRLGIASKKIESLKDSESKTILLKNRLTEIDKLAGIDTKRKALFNLVIGLTPQDLQISMVSLDKNGNMTLVVNSQSLSAVDQFITKISAKENAELIKKLDLGSFSLGRDGVFRLDLKITPNPT